MPPRRPRLAAHPESIDLRSGVIERGSGNRHPACSTPATDGERVFVYFGAFGLVVYDLKDGTEPWSQLENRRAFHASGPDSRTRSMRGSGMIQRRATKT